MAYLYRASIQGIQGFIFETSKLNEKAGASELVEQFCTTEFFELAGIHDPDSGLNLQFAAAGNIKYLFQNKEDHVRVAREFPRRAMQMKRTSTSS